MKSETRSKTIPSTESASSLVAVFGGPGGRASHGRRRGDSMVASSQLVAMGDAVVDCMEGRWTVAPGGVFRRVVLAGISKTKRLSILENPSLAIRASNCACTNSQSESFSAPLSNLWPHPCPASGEGSSRFQHPSTIFPSECFRWPGSPTVSSRPPLNAIIPDSTNNPLLRFPGDVLAAPRI
jgi:hypothetical protein